jgi:hypothetical protein
MARARRDNGTDADEVSLEEAIRAELEAEHLHRLEDFARTRERARERGREKLDERREVDSVELRKKMREEFYKEKGYVRYTDSRGREKWIPAEESEWRSRVRQRNSRNDVGVIAAFLGRHRQVTVWVFVVLGAIGIGLYLVR